MDALEIQGQARLKGRVRVSSAKNSSLPIIAASLLFGRQVKLANLPLDLKDIRTMLKLIEGLGCQLSEGEDKSVIIDAQNITCFTAPYELVKTMRASILVLGPLLSRYGKAQVSLPGGCAIGARPIDIHLKGLEKMGAKIVLEKGYVDASVEGKLKAGHIVLPSPSVGATENLMMAAVYADGLSVLENVAREPEIVDLANFLRSFGVKISGDGSSRIEIQGITADQVTIQEKIQPHSIIPDRIEAGTFLIAALMNNTYMAVENCNPAHLEALLDVLEQMGAKFSISANTIEVMQSAEKLRPCHVETAPYPGFPTDLQAQIMALLCLAKGASVVTEHIFENRFMHVSELNRMGANITLKGNTALIDGVDQLSGAPVMCTDLRASAALVLSGLVAQGKTTIQRVYHLDRGYEGLDSKLVQLGAKIKRISL